jgi:hypothetical protein
MGNMFKKLACSIYPQQPMDDSSDDESICSYDEVLPSKVMEREYMNNERKEISNDHILLRPSQIISIENKKLKDLEINNSKNNYLNTEMDEMNSKADKIMRTKGVEEAIKHMFTREDGSQRTYGEMRNLYG